MSTTIAFVYKWTHLPTMMWYVGSRTTEGCNPSLRWAKNNKNGWKFIPKTLVATEENVQLNKGEINV